MPRARTLLMETYDILKDPEKWNGSGGYDNGKKCILTALHARCVDHSEHRSVSNAGAIRYIKRALRQKCHIPKGTMFRNGLVDIMSWNDHATTTHGDVLYMLEESIKMASFFWEMVPNHMEVY